MPFYDHMLDQVAAHGGFSLILSCDGDTTSMPTTASRIARSRSARRFGRALGDKRGIGRFGFALPMDEAEAQVLIDLSGRPYSRFEGEFSASHIGDYPTEMTRACLPLARRQPGRGDPCPGRRRERPPQDGGLLQGVRPGAAAGDPERRQRASEHEGRAVKLAIVDLAYGNIGSVRLAFERFGLEPVVTADADVIAAADRVVLPGVGAAGHAMRRIDELGLRGPLNSLRQPALGICLGMQLLFESSDEADTQCLGIIRGQGSGARARADAARPAHGLEQAQGPAAMAASGFKAVTMSILRTAMLATEASRPLPARSMAAKFPRSFARETG